jgi:hypothetical protein
MRKQFGGDGEDLKSKVNSNTTQIRKLQEQVKELKELIPGAKSVSEAQEEPVSEVQAKSVSEVQEEPGMTEEQYSKEHGTNGFEWEEAEEPPKGSATGWGEEETEMTDCEIYNKCVNTSCKKKPEQESKLANKICEKLNGRDYIDLGRDQIDCKKKPEIIVNQMKSAIGRYNGATEEEKLKQQNQYTKGLVNEVFSELGCGNKLSGGNKNKKKNKKTYKKKVGVRKNKKTNRKNNRKNNKKSKRN